MYHLHRALPPTLSNQTPAQMLAFAKASEKSEADFWRQVESVAVVNREFKSATMAQAKRRRLMK